ncbi:phenylalanine--tRNA ligase subunit beta [Blastopirellula sp. JC732]|uniref:Phenylalanine--tRNA ligase beta subunit n=1 Tax=Blastopirellula sediminis TaxID=2894196 RepID=A0A9X1MLF7_9BACT|nr:phenylalanine--tRNA ligase subunit beta [Blastopirellula sediminis]MCC9607374.1 phenylalanine--tRNA ligase subunit beta [Blastopirellula sediminis]MCC9629333.1 phenylalanine--tRNA ligase subunit beta [Blastopirellula sediminis]
MLVSWKWLNDYLQLDVSEAEFCDRVTMAGLNYDGSESVGDDRQLDLEVTSNRPDWLGHVGIAREASVLFDLDLKIPPAEVKGAGQPISDYVTVTIEDEAFCPRYIARAIKGVKVGPSPEWLARRLETLGIAVINNVVDITNYVLMEIGQPLHAFDLAKIDGAGVTVRQARPGEKFMAIDHKTYDLEPTDYVIADEVGAVAIAGVMGGADSEVTEATTDLLIEAAQFAALPVRTTSRRLKLKSDSSYRFERGVDPEMIDWASRRCCELILDLAGGELAEGSIYAGSKPQPRKSVTLRLPQLKRILGIEVPPAEVERILSRLGNEIESVASQKITVIPPSWRRDIDREIDLVEEVARIHGYDKIPQDAAVKMSASHRSDADRVRSRIRTLMVAAGMNEAVTRSVVSQEWSAAFHGWSQAEALTVTIPMVRGEDCLRLSLIPSLLGARRMNEKFDNSPIELYEIAKVYLPRKDELPDERYVVSMTSGRDFRGLKGVIETLVHSLNPDVRVTASRFADSLLDVEQACELKVGGKTLGFLGLLSASAQKTFELQQPTTVAELDLRVLEELTVLIPQHHEFSTYPAMTRDLNLIVDETLTWDQLEATVTASAGPLLEKVEFREIFRDTKKDGPGKKRVLFTITLRAADRTLTGEEADAVRNAIVAACETQHAAKLLG